MSNLIWLYGETTQTTWGEESYTFLDIGFFFSLSSTFLTIYEKFCKSKTTNVFYAILSFKWDPWWYTFELVVTQVFIPSIFHIWHCWHLKVLISSITSIYTYALKYLYLCGQLFLLEKGWRRNDWGRLMWRCGVHDWG